MTEPFILMRKYESTDDLYARLIKAEAERDALREENRVLWEIISNHDDEVNSGHYCDVLSAKVRRKLEKSHD
jgi:hypothetical protein